MAELTPGIYDHLIDQELEELIHQIDREKNIVQIGTLDQAVLPDYLTRTLSEHIHKSLRIVPEEKRYDLANRLLRILSEIDGQLDFLKRHQIESSECNLLTEIHSVEQKPKQRPSTPLVFPSLFTGASGSPQLGRELELELESADRMDMLVSFIKTAGTNLLFSALKKFTDRGGELRIITTTYLGASDPVAIRKLNSLRNTRIKVNYDTRHSRLHAKAYFIHRNSGLSCAYIGSANLSHAAMTSGLEWTVKLPFAKLPDLFRRCQAEFDTYWESPSFQDYHDCDFENLVKATRLERHPTNKGTTNLTLFEITPYEHQLIVLDELEEARAERDQHRNLVVAATGTGKTMIAAFDYKRVCKRHGNRRPKLLFLAHRKEILEQAQDTFRQVLGDGNFGEPLYDGMQPERHDYLFCSVASFNSRKLIDQFGADYWDFVILDEAHHGKASSYRDILNRLQPEILLGLTSTPERTDGSSIAEDFDSPLAAEIRLPDALEKKLLCPFHYYAISDNIDFTSVSWRLGKYNEKELSDLLTGNDVRVNLILKKIIEYLPAPLAPDEFDRDRVKAIGFCVSQKHARFMAESFNKAGVAAISLDSTTENETRREARSRLRSGEINFIFVVDLFNEGVDIPEVNCLLFLRPTESHVVYIQQLGRGLRHCEGKEQVIVLDFIGKERKEFRYDLRFKSILPGKRHDLNREIADGFPHLPAGCSIHFERTAHRRILDSIRKTFLNIDIRINEAFSDWQGQPPPTFLEFIKKTEEIPVELLTRKSWSDWKQGAGFQTMSDTGERAPELNSLARVSLVTSPNHLRFLGDLLRASPQEIKVLARHDYAPPAYYLLWNKKGSALGFDSYRKAFEQLRANRRYASDLAEVIEYAKSRQLAVKGLDLGFPSPLELHGKYSMREVCAAFGKASIETSGPTGTGVVFVERFKLYLHFVTFEKTEKLFSESTMYRDYLSSRTKLHWESQSNTARSTRTGQNYIHHRERGCTILFFSRFRKSEGRLTSPFTYMGPARFVDAKGDRPIEMVWELECPVTHQFFHEAKLAAGIS